MTTYSSTILRDFIDIILKYDTIEDILDTCSTQSEKGYVYERLYDIVLKFGLCDKFTNKSYNHIIGNVNNGRIKIMTNLEEYLGVEKVISGNSKGCSDITMQHKLDGTYIFCSCKYPKLEENGKKQKPIFYYDVQNIIAMIKDNEHIYIKYQIFLIVPDKKIVVETINKSLKQSLYITKHMTEENMLDIKDLNTYFKILKYNLTKYCDKSWNDIFLNKKEKLVLRFHQKMIIQKTNHLIANNNKSFLWGCKCRSGKTYMVGGIISHQCKLKRKLNVLIISPAPTETIPQFTDELFNKFKDFNKFKIFNIDCQKNIKKLHKYIDEKNNNIFIMSKQLLQNYIDEHTIDIIKNLNLDMIIFDENHCGGTTELSKSILNSYRCDTTVTIYLTATYDKPLKEWNILSSCQMYWDVEDEQLCKCIYNNVNLEEKLLLLKKKHGEEYVCKTLKYFINREYTIEKLFKPYSIMPDLCLM